MSQINVNSPEPVDAVTVYTPLDTLRPVTAGVPASPLETSWKSLASTPVTGSLNTTFHVTLAALVGVDPPRLIDDTVGGVVSMVHV